jgi:cell division septation protein DedD
MKKQINPTIKAHLLRSGFYVLLLLAVCVIPFALAQRDTKKTVTRPDRAVKTQFPKISSAVTGARSLKLLPMPKSPADVLYDQYDNPGALATSSQDFETANDPFDDFTADDFVVPAGETWNISEVDVQGIYFNGPGPAASFNVFFYEDSGGLPGTNVYTATEQSYTTANNIDFVITLTVPTALTEGTYWVSVQARQDFTPAGQWGWQDRTVQANNEAAWQNPGGGFAVCPTWDVRTTCVGDADAPDQVFRLVGTTGGATPTPTATTTPSVTPTMTPSVTPSTTPSVTPSTTPSVTPSPSPSPSVTPSPSPTATPSATPTPTPTPAGCVFGFGYWKNHPEAWPVTELQLGNVTYTQEQLLSIMHEPVRGNGLVSLAHHLISAKLNVANGADPSCIQQTIADADALIGDLVVPPIGDGFLSPRDVNALKDALEDYNEGNSCAPSCDNSSPTPSPNPRATPRPRPPAHQRPGR